MRGRIEAYLVLPIYWHDGGIGMYQEAIQKYLACEISTIKALDIKELDKAMQLIYATYLAKGNIYIFGNGGSAATASHFQNDFNKGISEYVDNKFNFICLNDNIATLMAIANDISFDEVFRFQLCGKLKPHDLVIAISGSGNSVNILNAVQYAKSCRNKIIGMMGFDGGKLKRYSDIALCVPIKSMQITEDIHMIFDHLFMGVFYETICGRSYIK